MFARQLLRLGAVFAFAFAASLAPAAETVAPINTLDGDRLAIHGYDPVAYFVDGGPRKGRADLVTEHQGAVWRFSSEANRRRFLGDMARYTPVYGGYCAYGLSRGYAVKIDPEAWTIIGDRLYLNYDRDVQNEWLKDTAGYIAKADVNWKSLVPQALGSTSRIPAAPAR